METIDVSGLPEPVVRSIEQLVQAFRQNLAASDHVSGSTELTAEEWIDAFRAWADSHPRREVVLDDDRETIYAGRGE